MQNMWRGIMLAGLSVLLCNCASDDANRPAPATYFMVPVRAGDTVSEIAYRYSVDEEDIVAINHLYDRDRLDSGSRVRVPAYGWADRRVQRPKSVAQNNYRAPVAKPKAKPQRQAVAVPRAKPDRYEDEKPQVRADSSATFLWPVKGAIMSGYGKSLGGERNDGINIRASAGTPVRAAAGGTVTYVGNELKGYGNLLLIRHDNGYVTAYAHADKINVARGDRVERGQTVGYAGSTGDVTEPQLHFEIRQGTRPVDPKPYLVASM